MSKPLRSLSGLIDFECAARWCSFKLAARELNKTPAAISQQIKQLEQTLGFALFTRQTRQLVITEKGQELASAVAKHLRELNAKVAALQTTNEEHVLRISTTHSFAMKWLTPRLHRFVERHPELDIRIESNDALVNLNDSSYDVAIRYSKIQDTADAAPLLREKLVVVYSPALLKKTVSTKKSATQSLISLLKFPLLFEGTPENWLRLLKENRIPDAHYDFSHGYSHSGLLVQAAVAAHGVALAPYSIAYEDIRKGALIIAPFKRLTSQYGYRVLYRAEEEPSLKTKLFDAWLHEEVDEMESHLIEN
ncbi:LysR substrate-binding domain-containing protein [Solimicrobium silvestre]|uniref:Transcriptional regulator n=1 Tax=Solimicrobium silvestre TaxID=2099400 RepID=A0A2S9H508_9BURK|nr:LysR substrate-binding domain-containing protein [Solimicrobium silvestre]PRC95013.1 Transcriptional regulator [Solimicrobium silvestre]